MAVCHHYQVSHSHFLGGPDEWTPLDRAKAIWWWVREQERCGSCGTRASEWDESRGGHRHAYKGVPVLCAGCEKKEQAERALPKDNNGKWRVEMQARHTATT